MPVAADLLSAIDAFMAARKTVVGADAPLKCGIVRFGG